MKQLNQIIVLMALALPSCAGMKQIPFSSNHWRVNHATGHIENSNAYYSFSLSPDVVDPQLPIIASEEEAADYKKLRTYLDKICAHLRVDCDSILFYAPTQRVMLVGISERSPWKPGSISVNLQDDRPYTAWVREEDTEDWKRKPDEIFTNILLDKKAKQLLIVDRLNYKKRSLAVIHIIQTQTPQFKRMGLPASSGTWVDVTDPARLEPIAHWIEGRRKMAMDNYKLGISR